ncbi:sulfur carrier protein ThiS [Aliikangiella maris]|uniref:Sulfur carrier protein ThiS n=2 Tax=Aliikangiella maris TaxID=3162458 RepID=A0ABV3MMB9_9GAMM
MINVKVNGKPWQTDARILQELIKQYNAQIHSEHWQTKSHSKEATLSYAVAVNEQFIPRSQHSQQVLQEGDSIELVVPMQGG